MNRIRFLTLGFVGLVGCGGSTVARSASPGFAAADRARSLLVGDRPQHGLSPKVITDAALHTVLADGRVTLVSDEAMSDSAAHAVLSEVEQAYDFDTRYQGWSRPALDAPYQVAVTTGDTMKRITGQAGGGINWDRDSFITDDTIVASDAADHAFEAFVVAHELEHMHMERLGAAEPQVPIYAFEGVACQLGDWYVDLVQTEGSAALLQNEAAGLAGLKAADARDLFANFATDYGPAGQIYWREHLGGFFFEYIRAHVAPVADDVLLDWGQLTLAVGAGTPFDQAFQQAYGTTLSAAQDGFVEFMGATEQDVHARFKGTVWEGLEP
jgi:hypothetical protein